MAISVPEPADVMPSTKPTEPPSATAATLCRVCIWNAPRSRAARSAERQRAQQHQRAGQQQHAADRQQHEGRRSRRRCVAQAVEQPDADQRPRARPDRQPHRHPREHRALDEVPVAADRLGDRRVGEVGADRHHRLDAEHEDQQRRHQRAAAHAGDADEEPDAEAEEDRSPDPSGARGEMQAALDLVGAGPAAVAAAAGRGAVRAADRGVAAVVQRVVRDVVLGDVAPDVLLAPVGQRRALDLAGMAGVRRELRRARAAAATGRAAGR